AGLPGEVLLAYGLAFGAVVGQGLDQAQLAVAQVIRGRFSAGVFLGLEHRRLADALTGAPLEPFVAGPEHQVAVAAPLRARFSLVAAGDLGQGAAADRKSTRLNSGHVKIS